MNVRKLFTVSFDCDDSITVACNEPICIVLFELFRDLPIGSGRGQRQTIHARKQHHGLRTRNPVQPHRVHMRAIRTM